MTPRFRRFCSRWLLELTILALLLALLPGCQQEEDQRTPLRIGVAFYTMEDTFISTISRELERLALEREREEQVKINLSFLDGRSNQTTQLEQNDCLLGRGCDVLCVNIVDRTAAAVIIDKAEEARVPLIFFNRQPVAEDIRRWEQVYYVGADAEESGLLQGAIVRDAWQAERERWDRNGDGVLQYVMLEGEPGHQDALLRSEFATKPLLEAKIPAEKLASDTANWNRGQAAAKVSGWLPEFGADVDVIFANNDDMALGAIDACRALGMKDLPMVVGVDGTEEAMESIQRGTMQGTVLNDARGIARYMVDLSLAVYQHRPLDQAAALEEEHYIWLPYRKVTAAELPRP